MIENPAISCPFCRILRGELTPACIAFRDAQTAVLPSRLQQPRNRGHTLVVPIDHVLNIYDLEEELAGALVKTLARVAAAVKKACAAEGVSIRQNNDRAAGQDVFHLHFHVIPRFAGDGFVALDRSLGATEVPVAERIEQARKLADILRELN